MTPQVMRGRAPTRAGLLPWWPSAVRRQKHGRRCAAESACS